jgi:hypothetical protein
MASMQDAEALARQLPRSYEVFVRGQCKFRVGSIVFLSFSPDETIMGFAFPKEVREMLIESRPETFLLPWPSDLRYNWVHTRLANLDILELHQIVLDAWETVVPKKVSGSLDESSLD